MVTERREEGERKAKLITINFLLKYYRINANRNCLLEKDVGLEEAYSHTTFWYIRTNIIENQQEPLGI